MTVNGCVFCAHCVVGWAFDFFVLFCFVKSLRKIQQTFAMAVFYFAKAMLDYEIALSAYPAWFGEMRSHPPPLWDCTPSEDGG